ncbi:MAG TPA: cytochrome-c oxidase, cbb3-type subunit III [Rhodospirillaceae bacterium]|nr:cytochrome-c oxidase, cbb3-type subunit III [Rhodospirillaceae bacterium]
MATKAEKDSVSGQFTTGHEWDGIKELNTPLPRWWVWIFFITIAWAVVYCILYPSWPGINGYWAGTKGYHSRTEVAQELEQAKAAKAVYLSKLKDASLDDIVKDKDLLNFALAGGRSVFNENCAACHGFGGVGAYGFPNLADDVWLWGGSLDDVRTTISFGIRNSNPNSRQSEMPAYGGGDVLNDAQLNDLAEYVLSLSKSSKDAVAAARGQAIFANNGCTTCHGEAGEGNQAVGAPALSAGVWLYKEKDQKAAIISQVKAPKQGVMPSWADRGLDDATIKELTVYVHSLGGGK